MTTTILILAAHWPVSVVAVDKHPAYPGDPLTENVETPQFTVEPGQHGMSYITATRELRLIELSTVPAVPPVPVMAYDGFQTEAERDNFNADVGESVPPPSLPLADEHRTHGDDSAVDDPSDRGPVGLADTDKYD